MGNTDKTNNDPVWLRIKSLRSGVRGEQTELMAYCGLAQNTYNGWDKGTLKSYTKYIDKIAAFYTVSADWILTGAEKTPSENGERRKLRSVARLESSDITPELDNNIADYIDYLLSKRDKDK